MMGVRRKLDKIGRGQAMIATLEKRAGARGEEGGGILRHAIKVDFARKLERAEGRAEGQRLRGYTGEDVFTLRQRFGHLLYFYQTAGVWCVKSR